MSEFDKEAEREKLREQFAEDEHEREATQRMSELLLQGATMTNKHCDVHGDPLFRYDGEEFCPTCRTEGTQTQAVDPGAGDVPVTDETPTPDDASPADSDETPIPERTTSTPETSVQSPLDTPTTDGRDVSRSRSPASASEPNAAQSTPSTATHTDLSETRASLARTVTRFASEAEEADDLARAREYLAAVEDAANALTAVRDAEK